MRPQKLLHVERRGNGEPFIGSGGEQPGKLLPV
jgi:hypothetical protein